MMELKHVLTNFKNFDGWDFKNYPLTKNEKDAIVPILERAIPISPFIDKLDDGEIDGTQVFREVMECPVCGYTYTLSLPKFCKECGQAFNK